MNGIVPFNDMTGGWVGAEGQSEYWHETTFIETGSTKPFIAEIKGILTQGLDGAKGHSWSLRWVRKYKASFNQKIYHQVAN